MMPKRNVFPMRPVNDVEPPKTRLQNDLLPSPCEMESRATVHRRLFAALSIVTTVAGLAGASSAEAGDWMFRRSYYSHNAGPNVLDDAAPSRSAYREPRVGAHPRFAIRGGWRFNSFVLQNGTNSVDMSFFRENFYDVNY